MPASSFLLALEALVLREDILAPFRDKKDRRDLLFYALGMLGIQLTFFLSIRDANAATAALTVTTGPLFVTGWTAYAEHRAITKEEWISVALAMAGVSLLVTKGDFSTLDFSPAGVLWGIASAACGAFLYGAAQTHALSPVGRRRRGLGHDLGRRNSLSCQSRSVQNFVSVRSWMGEREISPPLF